MKITHNFSRVKCDMAGCQNLSEYSISNGEQNSKNDIHFCPVCLSELYNSLSKLYTPKSIRNKFNHNADAEIKKIFEKGEK